MSDLDKFFDKQKVVHPMVRYWESEIKGKKVKLYVEVWEAESDEPFSGAIKLYVHFWNDAREDTRKPDEVDWDAKLNEELIRLKVPATSTDGEALRFFLVLKHRLSPPSTRFGDGFFNGVLVAYLASVWGEFPEVRKMLDRTATYAPSPGRSATECLEMIEETVGYCIDALHEGTGFGYNRHQTLEILANAFAMYLDDRFHITARELMGFT